jgi:L-amino acid N-acyltransferase YncA
LKPAARKATVSDIPAIVNIYNQGIEDRIATFETRRRTPEDIQKWFDGRHPIVVVEEDRRVIGFAATYPSSARECYAGITEFSVYVERNCRGQGIGKMAMMELLAAAEKGGFWKLLSRVFPENEISLRLLRSLGFREVGIYEKHAQLDGVWRDVVIVEYLIQKG